MKIEKKWVTSKETKDNWETPQDLWESLNMIYSFNIDAAATVDNAKTEIFLEDGFGERWVPQVSRITGGKITNGKDMRFWCNPPYGRMVQRWIDRGFEAKEEGATVVFLLPARTDTIWFHKFFAVGGGRYSGYRFSHAGYFIQFIQGRLFFEFGGKPMRTAKGERSPALFPSMIVVLK